MTRQDAHAAIRPLSKEDCRTAAFRLAFITRDLPEAERREAEQIAKLLDRVGDTIDALREVLVP